MRNGMLESPTAAESREAVGRSRERDVESQKGRRRPRSGMTSLARGRSIAVGLFQLPQGVDCNGIVQILTSSSRSLDAGMHSERPSFNWFYKIIALEAEESVESKAANTANSNNNKMSSRGGEASGAAAPGPRGDGRPAR